LLVDSYTDEQSRANRSQLAESPSISTDGVGDDDNGGGGTKENDEAEDEDVCWPDEAFSSEESEGSDEFAFFSALLSGELEEE
uniref:Uncharacterized protein n=1 Tax=Schistocephalus solidus TaxID=70667 RepID=A0A183TUN9_SCHSO